LNGENTITDTTTLIQCACSDVRLAVFIALRSGLPRHTAIATTDRLESLESCARKSVWGRCDDALILAGLFAG